MGEGRPQGSKMKPLRWWLRGWRQVADQISRCAQAKDAAASPLSRLLGDFPELQRGTLCVSNAFSVCLL